eukprot:5379163-Amphidinium_carterae.1
MPALATSTSPHQCSACARICTGAQLSSLDSQRHVHAFSSYPELCAEPSTVSLEFLEKYIHSTCDTTKSKE